MGTDRILIVDDSRLYREVLKATLTKAGYAADAAESGEAGMEAARQRPPDLIVTDMEMPGISGGELCRRLKADAATRMVPIIMLTASTETNKIEQLDAGADDYIPKSADVEELLAKVRVFLRIKHLQDQLKEQNERLKYENEMNERELQMARDVQLGLLPREGGRRGRLHLAFRYIPMRWVGGDLFDVVGNSDGSTTLFISDVSGHGVGAAFVTAMIKTSVLAYCGQVETVDELVSRVNAAISNLVAGDTFVTAFFGMLDPNASRIQYINAGHPPVLVVRGATRQIDQLEPTQLPLGVLDDLEYESEQAPVSPGDRLVLYTDGVIEARSPADEMYGMARFTDSVLAQSDADLDAMVESLLKELVQFAGRDIFDDDVNLVACEVAQA